MSSVTFTRAGALAGVRRTAPLVVVAFTWGAVFGVLARQVGLTVAEAVLMSGLVFAGGSQLVAVEMWRAPLPVVEIIVTTLVVNLRHVLMGAAIHPWFKLLPPLQRYGSTYFMTDESWALTQRELADGEQDAAFLLGSGLTLFVFWVTGSWIGQTLGSVIADPAAWGLDFISVAVFTALLVGMWRGRGNWLPWLVAAGVALVAAQTLPGKWYILLGGLAGSLVGACTDAD